MRKLFTLFLFALLASQAFCQEPGLTHSDSLASVKDTSYWKKTLKVGFNLNQASFSENWKGGGVNSLAYMAFLNATVDYEKDRITFNNLLELQYGSINNKNSGYFKNVDRIYFDSKLGYKIVTEWNAFVAVNYLTQFYEGLLTKNVNGKDTNYYVSNFMAPGYLTESIGVEYKPVDWFFLRFGTGAFRQTFVSANAIDLEQTKRYGVDPDKNFRNEFALMFQAGINKDLHPNINLKSRYLAFANYELSKEAKAAGLTYFDYIDHRLDVTITAKITKYISTTLSGTLLYDYDQDKNTQYTQSLGLGVLLTL